MTRATLFVVNNPARLKVSQTTTLLLLGAAARGPTWITGATGLDLAPSGALLARAQRVAPAEDPQALITALAQAPIERLEVDTTRVIVRTNPGRSSRGWVHTHLLTLLRLAAQRGVTIVNHPNGLTLANSKAYLNCLPAHTHPETLISTAPSALRAFVQARSGATVLKPAMGTQGRDVFRVTRDADNLSQILEVITRHGAALAQTYVPEAPEGDVRVLLLDGVPLEVDGLVAAVRRRPPTGDFRSNIAVGGRAERVHVNAALRAVCQSVGPRLRADGLRLVGLDFVGHLIVEVNVFAPGGLGDAGAFTGRDFVPAVLDALLSD
jgi:glutathione synthase